MRRKRRLVKSDPSVLRLHSNRREAAATAVLVSSNVRVTLAEGECVKTETVSSEAEISSHQFSRLSGVACFQWLESGMATHIYLVNSCPDPMQANIRWLAPDYSEDLSYRIPRGGARLISFRGQTNSILGEGPWNFSYGTDVWDLFLPRHEDVDSGRVWQYWNASPHYVCFYVNIFRDEHIYGYASGVADPNETVRVWYSFPGHNDLVWLVSARADPP
jgi:hypothetical protein